MGQRMALSKAEENQLEPLSQGNYSRKRRSGVMMRMMAPTVPLVQKRSREVPLGFQSRQQQVNQYR